MATGLGGGWTSALARWASSVRFEDLPEPVVHHVRRSFLDFAGAAVAGSATDSARLVREYAAAEAQPGPAVVIGSGLSLQPAVAALANGTAAHGIEADDGFTRGGFHPGAPILPAILAVAQQRTSGPAEVMTAIAAGYEVACRLAWAGHPATRNRGFHNTPVAGVFGAAAGTAALLGADADEMAGALGLAGSHASGLFEFLADGSEVKRLHAGKAARDGVICAELAHRGLGGPATVLEGRDGYAAAYVGESFSPARLAGGLGQQWEMLGTYIKPYPCCRHLHGAIDAIIAMTAKEPVEAGDVDSVLVETFAIAAHHDSTSAANVLDAQMSLPYAVAVTLLHGAPDLADFGAERRADSAVRALMERVEVVEAADCQAAYPAARPARVTVRAGSACRVAYIEQPYGEPGNPISDADLGAKFHALAAPVLGGDQARRLAAAIWSFEDIAMIANGLRL